VIIIERRYRGLDYSQTIHRKTLLFSIFLQQHLMMEMAAMSSSSSIAQDVAKRLSITTTTFYMYVNGDGAPKELASKILTYPIAYIFTRISLTPLIVGSISSNSLDAIPCVRPGSPWNKIYFARRAHVHLVLLFMSTQIYQHPMRLMQAIQGVVYSGLSMLRFAVHLT
jgi:hypothetical protein